MFLGGKISIILFAVHLLTAVSFYILRRTRISEKFRSSVSHPANFGKTAIQLGGLVIVPISLISCCIIFYTYGHVSLHTQLIICMPFILLFIIGIVDDLKPIPAWTRLIIHVATAISITLIILQTTKYAGLVEITRVLGMILPSVFMVLAITWMINTVNFIDGMDLFLVVNILPGILLFSFLSLILPEYLYISVIFLIFLSSLLGFVWFNRPTASIYMGDSGTLCIGFLLSSNGVFILAQYGSIAGFIPFSYILIDTTFTILNRASKRENLFKTHNHHAYQVASRNGINENTIRFSCFLVCIINASLGYLCFLFEHAILWQCLTAGVSFLLSTIVFFYFHTKITIHTK
jgi:UDP-N-acetylmuramyl pentapeptide phosphotransferase/UDP-N-acetylglucosamine-1-phosphate transferase